MGFGSGVKIGHMPLALGEKQFFDHTKFGDDAIVLFMDPIKQLHLAALTIKFLDASSAAGNSRDLDGYVGLAVFKIDENNSVGGNITYLNEPNPGALPEAFKLINLGVHANGNAGMVGYKAEADMQLGSQDTGDAKQKFRGFGVMAGVNVNLNPVNVRAQAAYGSGDKDASDKKIKSFQTFLTSGLAAGGSADQHYTLVYEYKVASAAGSTGYRYFKHHLLKPRGRLCCYKGFKLFC